MASATFTDKIYQPSDLNRGYRAVLDEARESRARLRDTDGLCLLVIPEERVTSSEAVNDATANFLILEGVVEHGAPARPSLEAFGQWPWLRVFDHDDLEEFVAEMREALVIAARERSVRRVNETLRAWYNTAVSLEDPVRRDILLGGVDDDDFVDARRPEAAEDQVLAPE